MKVLSVIQPWAQLIVAGVKTVETRSWSTKYRGALLIHASGSVSVPSKELIVNYRKKIPLELPTMAIIGSVTLRDVITARDFIDHNTTLGFDDLVAQERILGDLSGERFAWLLDDPKAFKEPVPAKGALGLWTFRQCRVCGCSECDPCIYINHQTCHWIEEDLCSNCKPGKQQTCYRQFETFIKP